MDANQGDILTMPHERIEGIQLEGIKKTVVRCYENIPYYKKAYDEAGFDPYSVESLDDLGRAPFVGKQDLRDNYPYGMLAVPRSEVREIHLSSGTTGVATLAAYTQRDLEIWAECFGRGIVYAGGGADDVVQVNYGYGLFTGGLGAHYGSQHSGAAVIPASSGNTERQIRLLKDLGTTIMCCTPSYAMHIADTALEAGIDPSEEFHLRAGIHGAEPFSDSLRAELERKLGYKVLDVYGLTETMGPGVAIECWEQTGLHLAEDHFYAAEDYHQDYLDVHPGGYCHVPSALFEEARKANADTPEKRTYKKATDAELRSRLNDLQYAVTQKAATEAPHKNAYDKEFRPGIYVDITTGEPLFLSTDKFESGCGWPAFSKPIDPHLLDNLTDNSHGMQRTEVRSKLGGAHLGHVFNDGPKATGGLRYCINSASLRFVPKAEMEREGYGALLPLLDTPKTMAH